MEQESQMNCDVPDLWLEHQQELKNFIFKRVKDRDLANDISQEVLLKVYNFCRSKSGVKNVRSWLFQIAQNTIIDHYRKQSKISYKEITEKFDDRKSTRLNSSHVKISYAVFCL